MSPRCVTFLFPGQESLVPGVARDIVERCSTARDLLALASELTGQNIEKIIMRGGARLTRSEVIQPALTAISLGVVDELLSAGVRPELVAGLSLGEIAAWSAAGCIDKHDAIRAAAIRGRVMGEISKRHAGGLLALRVEDDKTVQRALDVGRDHGLVSIAARNAPDEIVLTGQELALRAIAAKFSSRRLAVAGPWHSELMQEGVEQLRPIFEAIRRSPATSRLFSNRTGALVVAEGSFPDMLVEQLVHPIEWSRTLQSLVEAGSRNFVTIGPGKVLGSLVRRNLGDAVRVLRTDDMIDLERTIDSLLSPAR